MNLFNTGFALLLTAEHSRAAAGLARISHTLASVPSLAYALLYLGLVPIFAFIYYCLPHKSFHHATIQYEESVQRTEEELRAELAKIISGNVEGRRATGVLEGWQIGRLSVGNLHVGTNDVRSRLYGLLETAADTSRKVTISLRCDFKFNLHPMLMIDKVDLKFVDADESEMSTLITSMMSTTAGLPPLNTRRFLQILFPTGQQGTASNTLELAMPASLSKRFEEYADALNGFPTMLRGHFWRMLYLSAVTVTTSFGDILPLTSLARILVTVQSMSGVILIGLFLNALAHEWGG